MESRSIAPLEGQHHQLRRPGSFPAEDSMPAVHDPLPEPWKAPAYQDADPSEDTMSVQRNLIKQLQQLVRQHASTIEHLQSEVQRLQQGTRETDVMYLDRLQGQQNRLDDRQAELHRVRREADMFRKEVEHLRAMMGGLENEVNERERIYSKAHTLEREKIDHDHLKRTEAFTRMEQEKQQAVSDNAVLRSTVKEQELELARSRRAFQEEQRGHQIARREAETIKHEKHQLFEELTREQRQREEMEDRHRKDLEASAQRLARLEQDHRDERVNLATQATEQEIRTAVLQSQVQRLEMELLEKTASAAALAAHSPPHHSKPGSAVLLQLGRSEEDVNRLRQQVEVLEEQKREQYRQVGDLEARLEAQVKEARRAAHEAATLQEQNLRLEKTVKGLGAEVEIMKEDLNRSHDKNRALEQSLLEVRVHWQRDKAGIMEKEHDSSMRSRTLEQDLREREMELELKGRDFAKLEASHAELTRQCNQLMLAKNEAVNSLVATAAGRDEDHRNERLQLQRDLEASMQQLRDLKEELQTSRMDSKAQVERLSKSNESQRKELHDLSLELGRLRVKVEEKDWQTRKLESALTAVQQRADARDDTTQHLKDSLQAARREIEKLRRERDSSAREARETEEKLRTEVARLQPVCHPIDQDDNSSTCSRRRRKKRCETAIAALGGRLRTGLVIDDGDDEVSLGMESLGSPGPVGGPLQEPWARSGGRLHEGDAGAKGGASSQLPRTESAEGGSLGESSCRGYIWQQCNARVGLTSSQRRTRHLSDSLRWSTRSRQGPRSLDTPTMVRALSRGSPSVGGRGKPREGVKSTRAGSHSHGGGGGGGEVEESEDPGELGHDGEGWRETQEFGCWSGGLPIGDTEDSFPYAPNKRAAPPLEPPQPPPLPCISSAIGDGKQHDSSHHHGQGVTLRCETADSQSDRRVDRSKRAIALQTKSQGVPLITAGAAAAARTRKAMAALGNRRQKRLPGQVAPSSRSGSSGGARSAPSVVAKPLPGATGATNTNPLVRRQSSGSMQRAPSRKKNRGERGLPTVHT